MEAKKVTIACFIGGTVCSALALLLAPTFWWLGSLAGFAAGYLCYDFRATLGAIPAAFQSAKKECGTSFDIAFVIVLRIWKGMVAWLKIPRPLEYTSAVLSLTLLYVCGLTPTAFKLFSETEDIGSIVLVSAIALWLVCLPIGCSFWCILAILMKFGGKEINNDPLTFFQMCDYILKGLLNIACFLCVGIWVGLFFGIWKYSVFGGKFLKKLVILIHSDKRLLCAVDSAIGGITGFLVFYFPGIGFNAGLLLIVFGGLIGAGLGVLNWEIVSKRILRVNTAAT